VILEIEIFWEVNVTAIQYGEFTSRALFHFDMNITLSTSEFLAFSLCIYKNLLFFGVALATENYRGEHWRRINIRKQLC